MGTIYRKCMILNCRNAKWDKTWFDNDYCPIQNPFRCDYCNDNNKKNKECDYKKCSISSCSNHSVEEWEMEKNDMGQYISLL